MVERPPQQSLAKTLGLIRVATAHPAADHTEAWNSAKEELATFLEDLRKREDLHRDNKVGTLKKCEAKAGILEKKRLSLLTPGADEHEHMLAAGVPGHIMLAFRNMDETLAQENRFLRQKVRELVALGFRSVDGEWVLPEQAADPADEGKKA